MTQVETFLFGAIFQVRSQHRGGIQNSKIRILEMIGKPRCADEIVGHVLGNYIE